MLIKGGGDQRGEGAGLDIPILPQLVHIHLVLHQSSTTKNQKTTKNQTPKKSLKSALRHLICQF